jgi:hypothetical protein
MITAGIDVNAKELVVVVQTDPHTGVPSGVGLRPAG